MAFPLSSRSIGYLVEALSQGNTDAQLGTLILKCEADQWAPADWPNKERRVQMLLAAMRADKSSAAGTAALELVTTILSLGRGPSTVWWDPLAKAVSADGWEWDPDNER